VYQDDVMLIAIHLAGYSWLEADKLRKAMGKKIPAEMAAQKEKLLKGFIEHGLSKKKADLLWSLIEPFAAYGFNKAHAASYGRVAYQTAYMKANFPVAYMTAIMTNESGDVEKIAEIVSECKRLGIKVLPPDVNLSEGGFSMCCR
jgi:DNA polymerase-3 subunit alpha